MADPAQNEFIQQAIKLTQSLRYSLSKTLERVAHPADESKEENEGDYINSVKEGLISISQEIEDLEKLATKLKPINGVYALGSTLAFGLDSSQEKNKHYQELNKSYRYLQKVNIHSNTSWQHLQQNMGQHRRNYVPKKKKVHQLATNRHENLSVIVATVQRNLPHTALSATKTADNFNVIQMTQGKVFKAAIALRGTNIEWIVVKASNEKLHNENGELDMWGQSKYEVFRKITEQAEIAANMMSANANEIALQHLLKWLHGYHNIFTAKCSKCSKHLKQMLPPVIREFRSNDIFHEQCRA
ncbi:DgyrCDS4757 [Dimorphilus gyrociliatus]|uniref:DgyrCDS4757 n=1 Tax=Dimorphilus gyrociliatus TaxID=2664684 RepID=A0A7I8VK51_9ANNE|nr:DgyrCDS4757 [Dimorphilus gyrociliatus]